MSDLICEIKQETIKYYYNIQFEIDIESQTILEKRNKEGLDNSKIEKIYINDFIGSLEKIENGSMDNLNNYIIRNEKNLEKMGKEEIKLHSGMESVILVYISLIVLRLDQHQITLYNIYT